MTTIRLEPSIEALLKVMPPVDVTDYKAIRQQMKDTSMVPQEYISSMLEEEKYIPTRAGDNLRLVVTRPAHLTDEDEALPVILHIHGGGWAAGCPEGYIPMRSTFTNDARAIVISIDYSLSPEVQHPVALEECFDTLEWVLNQGNALLRANTSKIAVVGDSAGGNLAAALCLLAKQRGLENAIQFAALLYPVMDANFDTESYHQFGKKEGYLLSSEGMQWFWDQYVPNHEDRQNPLVSPLQASVDELRGLPRTMIITGEADVLRDEAEAYARKLLAAGVPVVATRYLGAIHGFCSFADVSPTGKSAVRHIVQEIKHTWAA